MAAGTSGLRSFGKQSVQLHRPMPARRAQTDRHRHVSAVSTPNHVGNENHFLAFRRAFSPPPRQPGSAATTFSQCSSGTLGVVGPSDPGRAGSGTGLGLRTSSCPSGSSSGALWSDCVLSASGQGRAQASLCDLPLCCLRQNHRRLLNVGSPPHPTPPLGSGNQMQPPLPFIFFLKRLSHH